MRRQNCEETSSVAPEEPCGRTRRRLIAQTAAIAGGAVAAACAPFGDRATSPQARAPAKVVYWTFGAGRQEEIFRPPAEEYMRRHPETTVEFLAVPSGEIQEKVTVSWAADTVPDVVFDSSRAFVRWMDDNLFLELTRDFSQRRFRPADFYQTALQMYQMDGKLFGLPQGFGTSVMAVNLDLFRSAGVTLAPNFDETWRQDDLTRLLKQVVRFDEEGRMLPGGAADQFFQSWLLSYGADILTADQSRSALGTPEALAAAEWYARMHTGERVFMRPGIDLRSGVGFAQGNVAIEGNAGPFQMGPWSTLPFDFNVFLRPPGPRSRTHRLFLDGWLVFRGTTARDAAVDFTFFLVDEGCAIMERAGGYNIPALRKVVDEVFLPNPSRYNKHTWLKAAEQSKTDPRHAKWIPDIQQAFNNAVTQLRTGQAAAPRQALAGADREINAILDEYRRTRRS
jgi:multiple sugar transport system substrate-binding protein